MAEKFEELMYKMEEIVKRLEAGETTLDESLSLFEQGIKISKTCQKMLDSAEKKVSVLMADESGKMEKQPFDGAE